MICAVFLLSLLSIQKIIAEGDSNRGFPGRLLCLNPQNTEGCNNTPEVPFSQPTESWIFLFTRSNPDDPEFLHRCEGRLPTNTTFNPQHKTEIIIHGWLDGVCRSAWMREMKDQLLERDDYNVILVDWSWGNTFDYYVAASNNKPVSRHVASVIRNIMSQTGVRPETFHIIGHSFGSHIGGFIGQNISGIGRITALDPALAPFYNVSEDERLDPGDAELVDVIHTNGGTCFVNTIGTIEPLGHADFYVNGGTVQLSCISKLVTSFLQLDLFNAILLLTPTICSHNQATDYYKVSINPRDCQFVGYECNSYEEFQTGACSSCGPDNSKCAVMGMDFDKYFRKTNSTRKFYLDTSLYCPYCVKSNVTEAFLN